MPEPATTGPNGARARNVLAVVDTLGHLLALHVTAAGEQDSAQVKTLAEAVNEITGEHVKLAYVDQRYAGQGASEAAEKHGIRLEVVKHTEVKRGLVLLPRRSAVERSFAWTVRLLRLAKDYNRLASRNLLKYVPVSTSS